MNLDAVLVELGRRRYAVIAILACLVLMALSISIRPAPQLITLESDATSARVHLDRQALFESSIDLALPALVIGSITSATANGNVIDEAGLSRLLQAASRVSLEKLGFAAGSEVSIRQDKCPAFTLSAGTAELGLIAVEGDNETDLSLTLKGDPGGASEFVICPRQPLNLTLFGVSGLAFEQQHKPNPVESIMLSSLRDAKLSFPRAGTAAVANLVPLEGLAVRQMQHDRPLIVRVPTNGDPIRFSFVGRAGRVATNGLGADRSLMPRLIDHLVGNSPVAALIAAFGFFWSMLWGIASFWKSSSKA